MGDKRIEVLVLRVNIREGDHRRVIRRRISNAKRKSIREGDAGAAPIGRSEQILADLESLDKESALGFRGLEIVVVWMIENEIECQQSGLDVSEFVLSPIAEIVFANGGIELP